MKRARRWQRWVGMLCLVSLFGLAACAVAADLDFDPASLPPPGEKIVTPPAGFAPLGEANSPAGWKYRSEYEGHWVIRDGLISCDGQIKGLRGDARSLWTEKEFGDLVMIVDWRLPGPPESKELPTFTEDGLYARDDKGQMIRRAIPHAGDSGIYFRGSVRYQVNIWSQPMGSGDLNDLHKDATLPADVRRAGLPSKRADKPFGQWNRFIITMIGDRVSVVLNGEKVIDRALMPGVPPRGPIALQNHGDLVEFRNLFVKELPSSAAK